MPSETSNFIPIFKLSLKSVTHAGPCIMSMKESGKRDTSPVATRARGTVLMLDGPHERASFPLHRGSLSVQSSRLRAPSNDYPRAGG